MSQYLTYDDFHVIPRAQVDAHCACTECQPGNNVADSRYPDDMVESDGGEA